MNEVEWGWGSEVEWSWVNLGEDDKVEWSWMNLAEVDWTWLAPISSKALQAPVTAPYILGIYLY